MIQYFVYVFKRINECNVLSVAKKISHKTINSLNIAVLCHSCPERNLEMSVTSDPRTKNNFNVVLMLGTV